jgi:hypothetical protein
VISRNFRYKADLKNSVAKGLNGCWQTATNSIFVGNDENLQISLAGTASINWMGRVSLVTNSI